MGARGTHYGGIVLDGLVFHIDSAKQESYAKRGLRYMQNGNNSMFVDFADTSKNPSTQNAQGTIINGATFSNFAPYHLTPYYSTYWYNPAGNLDMILTDTRNMSSVWSTLEHSWDANGDTNDTKGSANGTIVTPVGETFSLSTMTYQSGKVGSGAFTFNGTNFISLPVYTLTFTSDFSASLWFYVPAGLTDSNLISSFDNKGDYTEYNGWSISYNNTTKSINFFIGIKMGAPGNPGSQYYGISLTTGNNVYVLNQWNHVLVTRKSGTRSRIYVNGVLSASDTNIYNPSYNAQPNLAYIGASYYAFSLPFYKAAPSGLKIDVVQTFTSELDSLAAGSLYSMSGLYSSSAFNNNGIGTFYGNIEFDGVDDYIDFGNTPEMTGITDLTVSAWFYVNKLKAPTSIIASRYNTITALNGWELGYNDNGVVWFGGRENASTYISITASVLVSNVGVNGVTANGGWYNAVGIKSGNEWSVSVVETNREVNQSNFKIVTKNNNNHLAGPRMKVGGTGNVPFSANTLFLARDGSQYHMNGRLMTLSVYNRALSLDEINQNYNSFSKRILDVKGIPTPLKSFEYMIVTYQYRNDDNTILRPDPVTGPYLGIRDLDSATFFMGTGTVEDYKRVGCGQGQYKTPDGGRTINNSYLYQPGDDSGDGRGESILINFKQMELEAITSNNDVSVELYAGWCNTFSGDIANVSVTTYIGGTLTQTLNVITSSGTVVDSFVYSNFPANDGCCSTDPVTGKTRVGTIYYNFPTNTANVFFY